MHIGIFGTIEVNNRWLIAGVMEEIHEKGHPANAG